MGIFEDRLPKKVRLLQAAASGDSFELKEARNRVFTCLMMGISLKSHGTDHGNEHRFFQKSVKITRGGDQQIHHVGKILNHPQSSP